MEKEIQYMPVGRVRRRRNSSGNPILISSDVLIIGLGNFKFLTSPLHQLNQLVSVLQSV